MIKVLYYNMGDTYHQDKPLESRNEKRIFYTRVFKNRLFAIIFILYCKIFYDYIEVIL